MSGIQILWSGIGAIGVNLTFKGLSHVDVPHTPFGFASSLRRETRLQDWTHQSPGSGNPPA
ncbi:hypothetical protein [Scytonema sp. PCC 10023]|uniref:hypothetical protein n=1 Tax=Scytonema sp. PCC 10023 TaxID=1680591 RepID=UPI0039C6A2DE